MSGVFQGLMDSNGRLPVGVGPITHHFRGLPFNALNQVVYGEAPIVGYDQGIPFNAAGEVVGLQATQATDYGPGAMPYGPNGELEVGVLGPAFFHQGVGFTAGGVLAVTAAGGAPVIVTKDFTLTPAQISVTSAGFRAAPAAGTLAPDTVYAGGTVVLVQATDDDEFRIQNTGSVEFSGISGNLAVQLGPYVGPGRIVMAWDVNTYFAVVPGIYTYMVDQIGTPTGLRLSAAPA
jgi:hypothetical protein